MTDCDCDACKALNERYASDPELLAFYRKKLLIRGWAGDSDAIEKAYVLAHSTWARGAAERGRERFTEMWARREKPLTETPSDAPMVLEDIATPENRPLAGVPA